MRHNKIIRREDGRVRISVDFYHLYHDGIREIRWRLLDVAICLPRHSTFRQVCDKRGREYNRIEPAYRYEYMLNKYLKVVTRAEIQAAFDELYSKIKPPAI